jgi:hypothetical protein
LTAQGTKFAAHARLGHAFRHHVAGSPVVPAGNVDPDLKDYAPVKTYLADVEQRMREVFAGSNIYNAFHIGYGDLGQFGQSVGLLVEDDKSRPSACSNCCMAGSGSRAMSKAARPRSIARSVGRWQRIVSRFGYDKVSARIKGLYDQSKYDERFDIWHAVEPRMTRDPSKIDKKNKPFLSNYWEDGETSGGSGIEMLEESGFDDNPIIAPPWELAGDDHYGLSPGQIALGDVKGLQLETKRKWEAIDKKVRPPMTGPTSMRNNPASLLPGSVTYVDDPTGKGYPARRWT